jgi:hypothetical protein
MVHDKTANNRSNLGKCTSLSRFSTSTLAGSQYLVPWLAAEGPLAYSPAEPPPKDYFFQYSWILPGIFNPAINLRRHYYFGSCRRDYADFLFDFWGNAMALRKSGPHYVALTTSLNNIRITTFIARESEVKIVDPSRIYLTDAHGCKVKFMLPTE